MKLGYALRLRFRFLIGWCVILDFILWRIVFIVTINLPVENWRIIWNYLNINYLLTCLDWLSFTLWVENVVQIRFPIKNAVQYIKFSLFLYVKTCLWLHLVKYELILVLWILLILIFLIWSFKKAQLIVILVIFCLLFMQFRVFLWKRLLFIFLSSLNIIDKFLESDLLFFRLLFLLNQLYDVVKAMEKFSFEFCFSWKIFFWSAITHAFKKFKFTF